MNWSRAVAVWVLIAMAETIHGILRRLFLVPAIGEKTANQIGVFIGSLIILAIAITTNKWIGARTRKELLLIGVLWTILMISFEVLLGRALQVPWSKILADYDPSQGGLMLIGMTIMLFAPLLAARARR